MNPKRMFFAAVLASACGMCAAQGNGAAMPDSLVIARDTFWDFGPPFNYYDLIKITKTADGLSLDQVLVTPHGQACLQPATVEERTATLHKTMAEFLENRNPCSIPDKELHRELNRCKKCSVFSGVYVMMQVSCNGQNRQLAMDILDRDIYDSRTPTPGNTSWSMRVLSELNDVLGPGPEAKPIFQMSPSTPHPVPDTPLANTIREGHYDVLFGNSNYISVIVHEAEQPPPPPPSVQIESVEPAAPTVMVALKYPPIAVAAHVEGKVNASFNVDQDGKAQNVSLDGPPMLQLSVRDAISSWIFPEIAKEKTGRAVIKFDLNCASLTH